MRSNTVTAPIEDALESILTKTNRFKRRLSGLAAGKHPTSRLPKVEKIMAAASIGARTVCRNHTYFYVTFIFIKRCTLPRPLKRKVGL